MWSVSGPAVQLYCAMWSVSTGAQCTRRRRKGSSATGALSTNVPANSYVMNITNFVFYTGVADFNGETKFVHTGDGIFSFTGEQ